MTADSECPRLRRGLAVAEDENDPRYVIVWDELRLSNEPQRLTVLEFGWAQLFNGRRTLRQVQAHAAEQLGGQLLPLELFTHLVRKLEEALFLDGPRFRERLD